MCRDRESGILVILLMVDLRVVEILGTLAGLSYPTRSWSRVRLHMYVVGCVCAWNFGTKFFLRRGECETPRKIQFSQKEQNRNFDKNPKFF